MKDIVIAYHCYMYGDKYMELMVEQMRLLISSGLYNACSKLYIGVVVDENIKPDNGRDWIKSFWNCSVSNPNAPLPDKIELIFYNKNNEETDTLRWVSQFAKKNPDKHLLYFHTKGITKNSPAVESWRHCMEYFCLEKWQKCIEKLNEGYDCCGIRWHVDTFMGKFPHYSGGFWWANTTYLSTLNDSYFDEKVRYYREFWIGSRPDVKHFCFHNYKTDPYTTVYTKDKYDEHSDNRKIHVICTAYQRPIHLRILIDSFLVQTSDRWTLSIIHDWIPSKEVEDTISLYKDDRINFTSSKTRNGKWGHPNRRFALDNLKANDDDYVLITNDDNYYVPTFVERMLEEAKGDKGIVACDFLHSYTGYGLFTTEFKQDYIDMGCFIVRYSIAKRVRFTGTHFAADGSYAERCHNWSKHRKMGESIIRKPLFIHN